MQPLWTLQAVIDTGVVIVNAATAGIQSYTQNDTAVTLSWSLVTISADVSLNISLTANLAAGKRNIN